MAMIHIHKAMVADGLKSSMIMQVHDELVFDVEQDELASVQSLVRFHMEHAVEMAVPLVVEMGVGNNWLDAH
jgi:DNA polymerase-1